MSSRSQWRRVRRAFDSDALKRVCEAREISFADRYDLSVNVVHDKSDENYYLYGDRGSDILFVAHLDTVVAHKDRGCRFVDSLYGPVVCSGALDDRLGAYVGLEMLPRLGLVHDILLTTGEESGCSTAELFDPGQHGKDGYNWVIEFDRGGTDVVMYQYEDYATACLVEASGARVEEGIYSDISYLEHLGVKCFNWGVGYREYHSTRGHAYLNDTFMMVAAYLRFHEANADTLLPHVPKPGWSRWSGEAACSFPDRDDDYQCDNCGDWLFGLTQAEHDYYECDAVPDDRAQELLNGRTVEDAKVKGAWL